MHHKSSIKSHYSGEDADMSKNNKNNNNKNKTYW